MDPTTRMIIGMSCFGEKSLLQLIRKHAADGHVLSGIDYQIADDKTINARSSANGNSHAIAINSGCFAVLYPLFCKLIAETAEHVSPIMFEVDVRNVKSQTKLGMVLVAMALDYITLHEVAHVAFGHLGGHDTPGSLRSLDEVGGPSSARSAVDAERVQAFELEADAVAVKVIARLIDILQLHRDVRIITERYKLISAYICAIDLVIKIFVEQNPLYQAQCAFGVDHWKFSAHPHPYIRAVSMRSAWQRMAVKLEWDTGRAKAAMELGGSVANAMIPNSKISPAGMLIFGVEVVLAQEKIEKRLVKNRKNRPASSKWDVLRRDLWAEG